ncbi:MAG: endonuclease/exonuclease/phosphatase family protein [Bacteroidales bacterium]
MNYKLYILTGIFLLHVSSALPQSPGHRHCIMFYNVENLFHPSNDPDVADDDFTPDGNRRWTFYRYNKKLTGICQVILAANGWDPPEVICLSEVENAAVLKDLTRHPFLVKFNYRYLHRDGPDFRGIDVAILYREDRAVCLDTTWITISDSQGNPVKTREILTAKFLLEQDTVLVAANHWTSKYGGAMETEPKRVMQARILGRFIDSAITSQPALHIVAGGDFNDVSGSKPLRMLLNSGRLQQIVPASGKSTYKYQGRWDSLDHLFIGGKLKAGNCRAEIPDLAFLLEEDEKETGMRPYRTYRGFAYSGGISDHLPLLLHVDQGRDQGH